MEGEVLIRAGGGGINRLSAGARGVRHPYMGDDSSVVFDLSAALSFGSMVQELDCGAVSFVCGRDGSDSGCVLAASRGEHGSGVWAFQWDGVCQLCFWSDLAWSVGDADLVLQEGDVSGGFQSIGGGPFGVRDFWQCDGPFGARVCGGFFEV